MNNKHPNSFSRSKQKSSKPLTLTIEGKSINSYKTYDKRSMISKLNLKDIKGINNFLSQGFTMKPKHFFITEKKTISSSSLRNKECENFHLSKLLHRPKTSRKFLPPKSFNNINLTSTISTLPKSNITDNISPLKRKHLQFFRFDRGISSYQSKIPKKQKEQTTKTKTNQLSKSGEKAYKNLLDMLKKEEMQKIEEQRELEEKRITESLQKKFNSIHFNLRKKLLKTIDYFHYEINNEYNNFGYTLVKLDKFSPIFRNYDLSGRTNYLNERELPKTKLDYELDNYSLKKEVDKKVKKIIKGEENKSKLICLEKWKKVIISAAIHFKQLCLKYDEFFSFKNLPIKPYEHVNSFLLFQAVKANDFKTVIRLIKGNHFLVYDFDHFHQTILHWMAKRNRYQMITFTLKNGAIANSEDNAGRTPLHIAASMNHVEMVMVLLYELANPFLKDKLGKTPMDLATNAIIKDIFKRVLLLYFIHSMGKVKDFEENLKRGLLFLYEKELKLDFSDEKFRRRIKYNE